MNGSHHGDNPLLRPTGIQIATKSYATLQAMAPTNNKTVHQTSFTPYYREQPRSTRIVFAYPRPAFSATNRTNTFQPATRNLLTLGRECASLKKPHESRPFAAPCGPRRKKNDVVRDQLFPQNLPVRAFDSRAQGFSPPLARQRSSCPPPSPKKNRARQWRKINSWVQKIRLHDRRGKGTSPIFMVTKYCTKILILPKILPTRFCFTFYGNKILCKNLPRFSDGRKCALLAKS